MSTFSQEHFVTAPDQTRKNELISAGDWSFYIQPQVGSELSAQLFTPEQGIFKMEGYHPNLHVKINFTPKTGFQITEGVFSNEQAGRMGVSIFGTTLESSGIGCNFLPTVDKMNDQPAILMSLIDQIRNTIDTKSKTPQIIRGFAEPKLTDAQVALLEGEEEGGITQDAQRWIEELGVPVNSNPYLMKTRKNGGVNIFTIKFPSTFLKEVDEMTQGQRQRWKLSEDFMKAEAKDKVFEGISRSMFIRIQEIIKQEIWSGTCDMMTIIGSARLLENTCRLDFSDYWDRLPPAKVFNQTREVYPISTLDPNYFDSLIGGGPKWEWTFNGNHDLIIPVGSMWAINNNSGHEFAYGRRQEATPFDGSVFAYPQAVYMPVVEKNGQLFVGGRYQHIENIGEENPFIAGNFTINPKMFSPREFIPKIEEDIGLSDAWKNGLFKSEPRQIITVNPNSAHEVEGSQGFAINTDPLKLEKSSDGKLRIINGDPDFVFVSLSEAINSPDGNTAALASAIYGSANIISHK